MYDTDYVVLDNDDVKDYPEEKCAPLSQEELAKVQMWLEPTDYATESSEYGRHRAAHLAGTGLWVLQTDQYRTWHTSANHGGLWIKATAGAGKSVLAASIIQELANEKVPMLYFFFRHIISTNQTPSALIKDYLSQILEYSPELQFRLYKLIEDKRKREDVSLDELWSMLVSALARQDRVYCIVDALDEMYGDEKFLSRLTALAEKKPANIKVLMTSRPIPRVATVLRHPSVLQVALQSRLIDPDISLYVRHRVVQWDVSEAIRTQVHDTMGRRADGHFLYARLMMDQLQELVPQSSKNLITALEDLPAPMADMYTQMLRHHSQRSGVPGKLQLLLLQWVTRAERPLRLLELSAMLKFTYPVYELGNNTKSMVRDACGPLLEILEDETVHPIHHSFTEYLYDKDRKVDETEFPVLDDKTAQYDIALTCLKYLLSGWHTMLMGSDEEGLSKKNLGTVKLAQPFLLYAASHWTAHLRKASAGEPFHTSAASNLTGNSELALTIDQLLVNDSRLRLCWMTLSYVNQTYLSRYDWARFEMYGKIPSAYKSVTALHVAAQEGLSFYVDYLVKERHQIDVLDSKNNSPLMYAAKHGYEGTVELLIARGAKINEPNSVGHTPLHSAAKRNQYQAARVLLKIGVDPFTPKTKEYPGRNCGNAPSSIGTTPVQYACEYGHLETLQAIVPFLRTEGMQLAFYWALRYDKSKVIKFLLQQPEIDVNHVLRNQTPLYLASTAHNVEIMRLLLDMGADATALSSNYFSHGGIPVGHFHYGRILNPLQAFVHVDRAEAHKPTIDTATWKSGFEMLLNAGLDPNLVDPDGHTVLHSFLNRKHNESTEEVLAYLLERGLSAKVLAPDGSNAFHLMAGGVSSTVVNILLSHGVDINHVRESDGRTPLIHAVVKSRYDLARKLLENGAKTDVADEEGNTALHHICVNSGLRKDLKLVKTLLNTGIDVHQRNRDGNTPLHMFRYRSLSREPELLDLFLQCDFDLNTRNKSGDTVLSCSLHRIPQDSFKNLVAKGSSLRMSDAKGRTILHKFLSQRNFPQWDVSERITYLVDQGADPLATDSIGDTLWHAFAQHCWQCNMSERLAISELLTNYGVSPTWRNNFGQTPLHRALSVLGGQGQHEVIDLLLKHTNINVADDNRIRPLHLAASFDIGHVCYLLELGADATALTLEGQSALMIACRARQGNIVCRLLDHYKNRGILDFANKTDKKGRSALYYACRSGRPEIVSILLQNGANPRQVDGGKETVLYACAEYLEEQAIWDSVNSIKQTQRDIDAACVLLSDRQRPCRSYHEGVDDPARVRESIQQLVTHGVDTSFLMQSPNWPGGKSLDHSHLRSCPLRYALSKGCEPMVSELLLVQKTLFQDKRTEIEQNSTDIETAKMRILEEITTPKECWQKTLRLFSHKTALIRDQFMEAAVKECIVPNESNVGLIKDLLRDEQEPAVEIVYQLGGSFLELDNIGDSPLSEMAKSGFTNLMRKTGQNAVKMNASWKENLGTLNANWRTERIKPILHASIDRMIPNFDMFKMLVSEMHLDPNEMFVACSHKDNPQSYVHYLAKPRYWWHTWALEYILKNGGKVNALDSKKRSPLVAALEGDFRPVNIKAIEILLMHGADTDATNAAGRTCLNLAAKSPNAIKLLLKCGANPSLGQFPFLSDVILQQDVSSIQYVIDSGADLNTRPDPGLLRRVEDYFKLTGEFNPPTLNRERIEHHAITGYPLRIAAHSSFNTPDKVTKATAIIELLLKAGAEPYSTYENGKNIVQSLADQGGIIEPFLRHSNYDIEVRDADGRTLLLAACESKVRNAENVAISNILVDHGASTIATDNAGRNAVHCLLSSTDRMASLELEARLTMLRPFLPQLVSSYDSEGRSPFHYAIEAKQLALIDTFAEHGADMIAVDPRDGSSALHHLAASLSSRHDFLLHDPRAVLGEDEIEKACKLARLDAIPDESELKRAVQASYLKPKDRIAAEQRSPRRHFAQFLARGLDINGRDQSGETPLFWLMRIRPGNLFHCMKVFEEAKADFCARNNAGESVLHKLAQHSLDSRTTGMRIQREGPAMIDDAVKTLKWLEAQGVDVAWEDEHHRTCLDVAAVTGAKWMLELFKRK